MGLEQVIEGEGIGLGTVIKGKGYWILGQGIEIGKKYWVWEVDRGKGYWVWEVDRGRG